MTDTRSSRILLSIATGLIFVVSVAGLRVGMAYWSIDRDEFDPDAARDRIASAAGDDSEQIGDVGSGDDGSGVDPPLLDDLDFEFTDDGLEPVNPDLEDVIVLPDMSSPRLPDDMFTSYLLIGGVERFPRRHDHHRVAAFRRLGADSCQPPTGSVPPDGLRRQLTPVSTRRSVAARALPRGRNFSR